ncbi:MAG: phospholipid carrier-dependent glycosyltransferase, partial [Candidatus Bathyarchaeota archaeon]
MKSSNVYIVVCCVLILVQVTFASQLCTITPPIISETEPALLLRYQDFLSIRINKNVIQESYAIQNQILNVTAYRETPYENVAFDVHLKLGIELETDTVLHYSFLAKELGASDRARIVLSLTNDSHSIVTSYYIGSEIPNATQQETQIFLFNRVGETLNTWYTGERNLWQDLVSNPVIASLFLNSSTWRITWIGFGFLSYYGMANQRNEALYNTTRIAFSGRAIQRVALMEGSNLTELSQAGISGVVATTLLYIIIFATFLVQHRSIGHKDLSFEIVCLLSIMFFGIFLRIWLLDKHFFQSDESTYVYSAYALSRGEVPYRDILFSHGPILFSVIAALEPLTQFNYCNIRLVNIVLYTGTTVLTYLMAKKLCTNRKHASIIALLCTALYSFYFSYQTSFSTRMILEILLILFTLGSIIAYLSYRRSGHRSYLALTGFLLGCALMTTMRALFFIVALGAFHLLNMIWQRK